MTDKRKDDENAEPGQVPSVYEQVTAPPPAEADPDSPIYNDDEEPDEVDVSPHAKEER